MVDVDQRHAGIEPADAAVDRHDLHAVGELVGRVVACDDFLPPVKRRHSCSGRLPKSEGDALGLRLLVRQALFFQHHVNDFAIHALAMQPVLAQCFVGGRSHPSAGDIEAAACWSARFPMEAVVFHISADFLAGIAVAEFRLFRFRVPCSSEIA